MSYDQTVYRKKEELTDAITNVLLQALREKCGVHCNEQQEQKLYDFVRFELGA